MGQVNSMIKTDDPIPKESGKFKMMKKSLETMKDLLKSELYRDIMPMIDHAMVEHASLVNVVQIQRIPENKTESLKEEIKELQLMVTKFTNQGIVIEKKMIEFERNFPRIQTDIGNIRAEIQTRCSKEDAQNINMQIPNFSTKQDVDLVIEKLKDKTDSTITNDIKIKLDEFKKLQQN